MNQVSSFLENIIAVDEPDNGGNNQRRPSSSSMRSRRSTQGLEDIQAMDSCVTETKSNEKDGFKDKEKEKEKEHAKDKLKEKVKEGVNSPDPALPGKVSDFWYLEDDQKKVANQLTDRIMEKVLSVMLSTEIQPAHQRDVRSHMHKTRPPLLVHLMSINTTQMAQKTSPVFEVIDMLAFCAGWYNPWHTVGVTLLLSVFVLRPYVVTCVPPLVLLHCFLVPSYTKLYPPDPAIVDHAQVHRNPVLPGGAPLGRYEPPRVVSQFLREFVMNFTDLQNHMVLYIRMYDLAVGWGKHYVLFEDLRLSTVVFLLLVGVLAFNLLVLPRIVPLFFTLVPPKLVALVVLWLAAALCHPSVRRKVLDCLDSEDAREIRRDRTHRMENALMTTVVEENDPETMKIGKTDPPVSREVEVFELHVLGPSKIWEPVGFTLDFFALNHPKRHLNELSASLEEPLCEGSGSTTSEDNNTSSTTASSTTTATATTNATTAAADDSDEGVSHIFRKATLAEIKPPRHWRFAEQQWQIDLEPVNWVNASYIMDLVSVDTDEKWVYDFVDESGSCDGHVFRRRRWIRQCVRDHDTSRDRKDSVPGVVGIAGSAGMASSSSDRLSKTFSTLLL